MQTFNEEDIRYTMRYQEIARNDAIEQLQDQGKVCSICGGSKEMECLVMGTDTRMEECYQCKITEQEPENPWDRQDTMISENRQGEINPDR